MSNRRQTNTISSVIHTTVRDAWKHFPNNRLITTASKIAPGKVTKLNIYSQQGELAALYPEAQKVAVSLINSVEFNLGVRDDLNDAERRRIARAWGVVYVIEDRATSEGPVPLPSPSVPIE